MDTNSLRRALISMVALACFACMKPNPLIAELADAEDSETGDESDTGESGDEDDTPLDLASNESNSCAPPGAFEPECGSCLSASCCELAFDCAEAPDCTCLASCVLAGGSAGYCKVQCNGAKAADLPELEPLLACADGACAASCS